MTAIATRPTAPPSVLGTGRGKLILALLCSIAFLDFVDASITNVALPLIRDDLHLTVQGLQWVPSGYLLTYGGFMLLGGRLADLLGRRRIVALGTALIGLSSLAGGLAQNEGSLVAARLAQGLGAALMLPAALVDPDHDVHRAGRSAEGARGVGRRRRPRLCRGRPAGWAAHRRSGLALGVLRQPAGRCPGARCALPADRRRPPEARTREFDLTGAVLVTVRDVAARLRAGEGAGRGLGLDRDGVATRRRRSSCSRRSRRERQSRANPLLPLDIFRVRGLAAADVTQLIAFAGFLAIFFFLTLYMQNVLGYSPIKTGVAYLPLCGAIAVRPA